MPSDDLSLLRSWAETRDAQAFNDLVSRYAALVHGACRRILGNEADAEDAAQECFLRLARTDSLPGRSLAGWLYLQATRSARDLLRSRSRRSARERRYAASRAAGPGEEAPWSELEGHIDACIAELPDDLREPLVAHFLERRTHEEIAERLGVSRQTVTHRIGMGIEGVRARLRRRGLIVPAALLATHLGSSMSEAAPASLLAALGKLAVGGIVSGASRGTAASGSRMPWFRTATIGIALAAAGIVTLALWDGPARPEPGRLSPETAVRQVPGTPEAPTVAPASSSTPSPTAGIAGIQAVEDTLRVSLAASREAGLSPSTEVQLALFDVGPLFVPVPRARHFDVPAAEKSGILESVVAFPGLDPKRYHCVRAHAEGCADEWLMNVRVSREPHPIVLRPGARIVGLVRDPGGAPVEGARVSVHAERTEAELRAAAWFGNPRKLGLTPSCPESLRAFDASWHVAESSAGGEVSFEGLQAGPHAVTVSAPGHALCGKIVNLELGDNPVELVLPVDGFVLRGHVREKTSGRAFQGMRVDGVYWSFPFEPMVTGPDGGFTVVLPRQPPPPFDAASDQGGYFLLSGDGVPLFGHRFEFGEEDLARGSQDILIEYSCRSVEGRLLCGGVPIAGAEIEAHDEFSQPHAPTATADDGSFTLQLLESSLPPGLVLRVEDGSRVHALSVTSLSEGPWMGPTLDLGTVDLPVPVPVTLRFVTSSSDPLPGGRASVRRARAPLILDMMARELLADPRYAWQSHEWGRAIGVTDRQGQLDPVELPEGTYEVDLEDDAGRVLAEAIDVAADRRDFVLQVPDPEALELSIVLVGPDGTESALPEGTQVHMENFTRGGCSRGATAKADGSGKLRFSRVPHGTWLLRHLEDRVEGRRRLWAPEPEPTVVGFLPGAAQVSLRLPAPTEADEEGPAPESASLPPTAASGSP